jgi:hypothetical protein
MQMARDVQVVPAVSKQGGSEAFSIRQYETDRAIRLDGIPHAPQKEPGIMHVLKRVPTVHTIELLLRIHVVGGIASDHPEAPRLCNGGRFIRDLDAGAIPAGRTS